MWPVAERRFKSLLIMQGLFPAVWLDLGQCLLDQLVSSGIMKHWSEEEAEDLCLLRAEAICPTDGGAKQSTFSF